MFYHYICNRNQYYTGSPKNAKPVVTISRAEGAWQRCHPIVAVMQPRMYIYIRVDMLNCSSYCSTMAQTLICGHLKPFAVGFLNATAQS